MQSISSIFLFLSFFLPNVASSRQQLNPLKFEFLNEGSDFKEDCGCTFKTSDGKYLGFAEPTTEQDPPILIKQNDKLIKLSCKKSTETDLQRQSPKMFDEFKRIYEDQNYNLELNFKTIRVCGDDRTCESRDYEVRAILMKNKKSVELKNIKALCGC